MSECFQQCSNDIQRDIIEKKLKEVIKESIEKGSLHKINWLSLPLIYFDAEIQDKAETKNISDLNLKRARRFNVETSPSMSSNINHPVVANQNDAVLDWDIHTIIGTSSAIEKQYLRLTSVLNTCIY